MQLRGRQPVGRRRLVVPGPAGRRRRIVDRRTHLPRSAQPALHGAPIEAAGRIQATQHEAELTRIAGHQVAQAAHTGLLEQRGTGRVQALDPAEVHHMGPLEKLADGNPGMRAQLFTSFGGACDPQQPGEVAHTGLVQTHGVLATEDDDEFGVCGRPGHAHRVSRNGATECCKSLNFEGYPPLQEVSIRLA